MVRTEGVQPEVSMPPHSSGAMCPRRRAKVAASSVKGLAQRLLCSGIMKKLLFMLPLVLSGHAFAAAPKAMKLVRDELTKRGLKFHQPDSQTREVTAGSTVVQRTWGKGKISLMQVTYPGGGRVQNGTIYPPEGSWTSIMETLQPGKRTVSVNRVSADASVHTSELYERGKKVSESSWWQNQARNTLARSMVGTQPHFRYFPDYYLPRSLFTDLASAASVEDIVVQTARGSYHNALGTPVTIKAGSTPKQIFEQLQAAGMANVLEADKTHERSETWENPAITRRWPPN